MTKILPKYARVVIIGGGMMGVGLLYHLAEEGWDEGDVPRFVAERCLAELQLAAVDTLVRRRARSKEPLKRRERR